MKCRSNAACRLFAATAHSGKVYEFDSPVGSPPRQLGIIFVLFVVILLTLGTVAIAAIQMAPRMAEGRIIFGVEPDRPAGFGYRMTWLAIRTRDTSAVLDALQLTSPQDANWSTGLGSVYDRDLGEAHVFVSPPVNGWTFVVGLPLPAPVSRRFVDKCTPLLVELGHTFVEAQYFSSMPSLDYFAWARMIEGRVVRAFAIGDEGVIWNKGRPSKEEKAMGLKLFEFRGVRGRRGDVGGEMVLYPTEDHLMELAAKWSIDPTALGKAELPPGLGFVARAPLDWRPVRIRKAA